MNRDERIAHLKNDIKSRVLVLDGAMGTMIQGYKLTEADFAATASRIILLISRVTMN